MTAGNNGADTPENDDPFAYLYRSEGGEGGAGATGDGGTARQPGVPRTSYNQVRAVGERQYGGQQAPQQPAYGRPHANYAAPETLPGGEPPRSGRPPQGQEPRRSHKGLLIGAVAVVAVVCIGISVAMITNNKGDSTDDQAGKKEPTASDSVKPTDKPSDKPSDAPLPKDDAGSLKLQGGATTTKDLPGARSAGGTYVAGMNNQGASVTWTLDVPEPGAYKMWVGYNVPGEDENLTVTVNGKAQSRPVSMGNFANAEKGSWDRWTKTWARVDLDKKSGNTVMLSCEDGNKCDVNIDQIWLEKKL
ncbi:carbohydrate-binding protein [Streptomyces pinistramenti]|uniref:carbohydrate-binding protein n=1 Tax=Streptomyces pinistramenti TaxID=2884812 RepID=UPI001D096D6D|nr:carbohydrate-binding protein [Streptomyces pinistramenti]MCB5908270.1 carbohydrate-binding protein [Streptomyces pinistramenti]